MKSWIVFSIVMLFSMYLFSQQTRLAPSKDSTGKANATNNKVVPGKTDKTKSTGPQPVRRVNNNKQKTTHIQKPQK